MITAIVKWKAADDLTHDAILERFSAAKAVAAE